MRSLIIHNTRFFHTKKLVYFSSSERDIEKLLGKYYQKNQLIPGFCTSQQSKKFSQRNQSLHKDHWKTPYYVKQQLYLSSFGLGTQGGEPNEQTDRKQFQALVHGLEEGLINVIDTDVNFRYGKSQKTINAAINYVTAQKSIKRQELFISTKCGYIMNDIDSNLDDKAFKKIIVQQKYAKEEEIVNEIYCLSPDFIKFSVEKSRLSLGLETIDLVYLNNPIEALLSTIGKLQMYNRIESAFRTLQQLRSQGKIRYYGIASFVSFRSPPTEQGIHGCFSQIARIAKKVGGDNHGLRFCLVPVNLGMPQALLPWQKRQNKDMTIFQCARNQQINVNICCPLFQGRLINVPFKSQLLDNITSISGKHLQLIRSINQINLTSTVFGSLSKEHVKQNLLTAQKRVLTGQQWQKILPMPKN